MKHRKSRKVKSSNIRENLNVTIPSDYPWKVLANLFADLHYHFTDKEKSRFHHILRTRDYDAYLALSEEWGPQSNVLVDLSVAEMQAKYQVVSLIKKFRFPSDDQSRRTTALKKFIAAEKSCKDFNENRSIVLACLKNEDHLACFTYAKSFLTKLLGDALPTRSSLTTWSRHGPGSNRDTKHGFTSWYHKYKEWPYSCTAGALAEAILAIKADERWLGALEDSYRDKFLIPKNAILNQNAFWSNVFTITNANRIAFVPKNSQTDRSIAIEPSMNLYLQLGVDGYIRRRLKRWDINLDSQEKNRELARLGSANWKDSDCFCTLDLSAASDSISTEVCRLLLPPEWYKYLMSLRSPYGELNDAVLSYEKISSMGNGYTFALESAIFAALVYGVSKHIQGHFRREECAIYGDDIIVRKPLVPMLTEMLNLCGFSLNQDKSFVEGPFRESCGADWFRGKPVRPVFFTTSPKTVMNLWTDINRLQRFMQLRFLGYESSVADNMTKWIPSKFKGILGPLSDEQFDSYLHCKKPTSRYSNGVWTYRTLITSSKSLRGNEFLFRKLMHDLRGEPEIQTPHPSSRDVWKGSKITGSGSRFTITKLGSVVVRFTTSVASYWQSEYAET